MAKTECKKSCDLTPNTNIIILRFNQPITTCENMFNGMENLKEIDLSNFHSEQVTSMRFMFKGCSKLNNINFGNIDTSKVKDMEGLFKGCSELSSINLSNFETSSLENANETFSDCSSLKSLDLSNFRTNKLKYMYNIFANCEELLFANLSSFDTSNVVNMQGIFYCCRKLKYADLKNFDGSSIEILKYAFLNCKSIIYINLRNFKVQNIRNVPSERFVYGSPTTAKFCIEDQDTSRFLLNGKSIDCSDFCFQENVILDLITNECVCNDYYKFEYNNKCLQKCPDEMYHIMTYRTYTCSNNIDENYYLDNDNIYKKCFNNCKKCSQGGNSTIHNCDVCIEQYTFINDIVAIKNNCYYECQDYYYFNYYSYTLENINYSGYTYQCSDKCYSPYNISIKKKKKCIDECKNDGEYIYEYNNTCYKECPENTKTFKEKNICVESCDQEFFEYNNNECYTDCPNDTYRLYINRNICSSTLPDNYYLDNNDNIYKKCYTRCKKCNKSGDSINNNCVECNNGYIFIDEPEATKNNCYGECQKYYYFMIDNNKYKYICVNNCPKEYNNLIEPKKKCVDDCKKDNEYIYEYNKKCFKKCPENTKTYEEKKICLDSCYDELFEYKNICYIDCPYNTYRLFEFRNICVDSIPENYYFDTNDNIYKKCYNRCRTCRQYGNDTIHNCDDCIENYMFLQDSFAIKNNCYIFCQYYYYFDEDNNYKCTQEKQCPSNHNKLINSKNKCIDDCKKDSDYIFEYNNDCLLQCEENLKIDVDTKHCLENCNDNQIIFNEMCYNDFPVNNSEFFKDGSIFIENTTNFDDFLNNVILTAYSPEPGNKLIIQRPDETIYQITNSKNELELLKDKSSNIHNISIINLGICESLLKKENNISENDSIIFIKSEIKTNKVSEKNVKYDAYNPYNKEKLNISLCEDIPINIYFPMELSKGTKQIFEQMKNSGYDMFDINDPFYQDICTPFDSSNGTDILLSDRINYIYYNDDTQCQSNCQYSQYSVESQYLTCSCSVIEDATFEHKKSDKFDAKKIYESFYEVLKYSNYDIIKCYHIILNINVLRINMGSIIVILYFSCYFICFFIFIFRGIIPLKIKLRYDLYKDKKMNNLTYKFNFSKVLYPPIKKKIKLILNQTKLNQKNNKIIFNNNIIKIIPNNKSKIYEKFKINSISNSKINVLEKNQINNLYERKIKLPNKCDKKMNPKQSKKEYSDYELNELEYEEALKLDKRSLCKIYCQALQREHLIFFTFFNCNDYNLISVKIARFVFFIVGDMALNVFFFSDDSMHKLFLSYGKYDFIQQIPQITYSTIISQIIEIFSCFLSLTDKYIYEIKSNFIKGNIKIIKKIINIIYIKLIIFFIFILIFFGIYWYIISIFCGVYRNTQIAFIKDSIISFSIGLIYPFIFYLFSASFRFCSLRSSKKQCKYLYKFSFVIPLF